MFITLNYFLYSNVNSGFFKFKNVNPETYIVLYEGTTKISFKIIQLYFK